MQKMFTRRSVGYEKSTERSDGAKGDILHRLFDSE